MDCSFFSRTLAADVPVHDGVGCCPPAPACCPIVGSDHFCALPGTFLCRSRLTGRAAPHVHFFFEIGGLLSVRAHPDLVRWSADSQILSDSSPSDRCTSLDDLFSTMIAVLHRHVPSQRRTCRRAPTSMVDTRECFEVYVACNGAWRDYRRNPELRKLFRAVHPAPHSTMSFAYVAPLCGLSDRTAWKPSRE